MSLGDYDTEVEAARAYDIAEIFFKRNQPTGLNFPVEDYKADIDFIVGRISVCGGGYVSSSSPQARGLYNCRRCVLCIPAWYYSL